MSWQAAGADPAGGLAPRSTRVSNLAHFLTRNARRFPDELALAWGESRWSWAEMEARVSALAAGLRARHGVAKGDRLLVHSTNCNQMAESMLAAFRLGAVWAPANFRQSPADLAGLAQTSGARGLIVGAEFPEHAAACPDMGFRLTIGPGESFEALIEAYRGAEIADAAVDRDDPCWFFFTSGTTGRPKAAVLTHGQMAYVTLNHLHDLMPGTPPGARSLAIAPLSHGAGVHYLTQVVAGAATVLYPPGRFDPDVAWALVESFGIANMFTVPTLVKMLADSEAVERHDRTSLRHVIYAGAPMYRADQRQALDRLGPVLVQYFGLGEVTGAITVLPPGEHHADDAAMRIGTCGVERTGVEVAIQDAAGRALGAGETGEICVTGPAVFAGYYNNPEANAESFRDGWFRTGDVGHMDAAGFVYVTGRESDMFISGGSNVHPREIEEAILAHDGVSETAVIGVPDPIWGEVGLAVCVCHPDTTIEAEALRDWLRPRIAGYKLPRRVVFLDEMPKTAYGKIAKQLIRETLMEGGLLDAEQPA